MVAIKDAVVVVTGGRRGLGAALVDGALAASVRGRAGMVLQDPDSQTILARVGDDVAFGRGHLLPGPAEVDGAGARDVTTRIIVRCRVAMSKTCRWDGVASKHGRRRWHR